MKRICLLICILGLIGGCATKSKKEEVINTDANTGKSVFNIEKADDCSDKITEYYQSNNKKIYFVCLKEIRIENKVQNENNTLSYILNKADQDFDNTFGKLIQAFFKESETFKDDSAKIYKNDNATVIVCHKMIESEDINEDIYIGDENLEYKEEFCTRQNY